MKVLALDYGRARTGLAVSDATGTLARPLGVVERVRTPQGLIELLDRIAEHEPARIVVGLPLTLRGERGAQARETEAFVTALRGAVDVPVESFDERFTTRLARTGPRDSPPDRSEPDDARAAAHLLSSYLEWSSAGRE